MKAKPDLRKSWMVLPFFWLWAGLSGCLEPVEGCLDVRAENFRADADENCCCTWPRLTLVVTHQVDGEVHDPASAYTNAAGESWRLVRPLILLSDFTLYFEGKAPARLLDSMIISGEWYRRDQVLLTRDVSRVQAGSFIESGRLDSVSFLMGLAIPADQQNPEQFPSGHALRDNPFDLWTAGTGFAAVEAAFLTGMSGDTILWRGYGPLKVTLPSDQVIAIGSALELPLTVNYGAWFDLQQLSGPSVMPDTNWMEQVRASLY